MPPHAELPRRSQSGDARADDDHAQRRRLNKHGVFSPRSPPSPTATRSGGAARPRSFVGTDRERRGPALKLIKPSRRSAWKTGGSALSSQMRCRPMHTSSYGLDSLLLQSSAVQRDAMQTASVDAAARLLQRETAEIRPRYGRGLSVSLCLSLSVSVSVSLSLSKATCSEMRPLARRRRQSSSSKLRRARQRRGSGSRGVPW